MATTKITPNFSENAHKVLCERYLSKNNNIDLFLCEHCGKQHETPEHMLERVSFGNNDYYNLMARLDFLPNSPTLFNAGIPNAGTFSACFKLDIDDSMLGEDSIMDTAVKAAAIQKWGGGVGFVLSNLRPKGAKIASTHGEACGPIAVLKMLHSVSEMITQGGKRAGAQMGILHIEHPDVREFIHCKDNDPEALSTFNISVAVTDSFMNDVLSFRESPAAELFREICESAHKTGDPGLYFIDEAERGNPTPWLGELTGTNPCFTGETQVWTLFGPKRFDSLTEDVPVLSQRSDGELVFRKMSNIRVTGKRKPVYNVKLKAKRGMGVQRIVTGSFRATSNHLISTAKGEWKEVKDLSIGEKLSSVYRVKKNQSYFGLRSTSGDSDMEHKIVVAWKDDKRPEYPEFHVNHIDENKKNNLPNNLEVLPHAEHNALNMKGDKNPIVRFPEMDIFKNPGFASGKNNGVYGKKHSEESKEKISKTKRDKSHSVNHEVLSVELDGYEDVYDGSVDETHNFFIITEEDGGVLVHNCGEVPLLNNEPCNLGSINLRNHLIYAERDEANIDFERLASTAKLAIRFLDEILDHNTFPHEKIDKAAFTTRKLGLGVMSWADALAEMEIHYDSLHAVELGAEVMSVIQDAAEQASEQLADEKGPFPGVFLHPEINSKAEYESALIGSNVRTHMKGAHDEKIKSLGLWRRNATVTCIAPTGSIAILANVSSGIEPHFALENTRTLGSGTVLEEKAYFPNAKGIHGNTFLPHTAMEISERWHVEHQAAFQKHTHLAVSKTINLPNDAEVSDVHRAYVRMWDEGCKGGTVFRDKSRDKQVLVETTPSHPLGEAVKVEQVSYFGITKEKAEKLETSDNTHFHGRKKLPTTRPAVAHHFEISDTEGYMHWGLYEDGSPGELFITASKQGSTIDGMLDAFAITVSMALQYGVPLESLIRKLKGRRFDPSGFTHNPNIRNTTSIIDYLARWAEMRFLNEEPKKDFVSRVVEQLDNEVITGEFCPKCSSPVVHQEGCMICSKECGWTKC